MDLRTRWHIPGQPDACAYQRPVCSANEKGSVVIAETLLFKELLLHDDWFNHPLH